MPADTLPRILCVDDEPNLLAGLSRQLRFKYNVATAESGQEGLFLIENGEPFAIIVSDMRMPSMDGATFLAKARQASPNSMRILLTGQSDLDSAIKAVNDGQIFRFLVKPCPPQIFLNIIDTAAEQYRLITQEQELLEKTLFGSVKVLMDILSLLNPIVFSQSTRIQSYVNHMVKKLNVKDKWQYEIAAMLSQIGCITVPQEILTKVASNQPLTHDEAAIYQSHAKVAYDLINKIPRLHIVAGMINGQRNPNILPSILQADTDAELLGANMLKIALEIDRKICMNDKLSSIIETLTKNPKFYHPQLVSLMDDYTESQNNEIQKAVYIRELTSSMKIDENIQTISGTVIISKGQIVSDVMLAKLKSLAVSNQIKEPFRVIVRQ